MLFFYGIWMLCHHGQSPKKREKSKQRFLGYKEKTHFPFVKSARKPRNISFLTQTTRFLRIVGNPAVVKLCTRVHLCHVQEFIFVMSASASIPSKDIECHLWAALLPRRRQFARRPDFPWNCTEVETADGFDPNTSSNILEKCLMDKTGQQLIS